MTLLGVLESDYDNANLLLLDSGVDGDGLIELLSNGYFGRNSSSSENYLCNWR